jgi:hypothetical protein
MPSEITVKTGFGEYAFTACDVSFDNQTLVVKRNGVPLLWTSWPWTVTFT